MLTRKKKRIILLVCGIMASFMVALSLIVAIILGPWRPFFWNLPSLLGFFGPRSYLVLLQNNAELRPTGGFISAVAEINLFFGFPSVKIMDSYQVPDPLPKLPAPEPFEYFIGSRDPFFAGWTFRDSNFSPDFPTSAKAAEELYERAFPGTDSDGVIALDFAVIEELLNITGPLEVEGGTFDKNNFFLLSQRLSKNIDTHDVEALETRKQILKPFGESMRREILRRPGQYRKVLTKLFQLGSQKHLLMSLESRSAMARLDQLGFAGRIAIPDPTEDFLHVNVANIGGRKADRYVIKDIRYRVRAAEPVVQPTQQQRHDSLLRGFLEITLEHLGSYNIQSDIYQAYVRTYVPKGSVLKKSSGAKLRSTVQMEELGFQVFADYLRLKPGEKLTLFYEYELPKEISLQDYRLQVIQQPGSDGTPLQIAVQTTNDAGLENVSGKNDNATPFSIRENLGVFVGILSPALHFHIREKADTEGPVVLWQEFADLTLINVRLNEELDPSMAVEVGNYHMIDSNQKNPSSTDTIEILDAKFESRDLWLTIKGITRQPEEHYQLIMRDITDLSGNMISPNPLMRTLVQRIKP